MDLRKQAILNAVVYDFVTNAEPVSSKRLQQHYGLNISTATIRNELATLEELGYLYQPHTSAGRIPTDAGYRFYVNSLNDYNLSGQEENEISAVVTKMSRVIEDTLKETSVLLSHLTHYVSVVFAPFLSRSTLKRLDLVSLGHNQVLLVAIMSTGCVEKSLIDTRNEVLPSRLAEIETLLNQRLDGANIADIRSFGSQVGGLNPEIRDTTATIIGKLIEFFKTDENERVFMEGATNILHQPDFDDLKKLRDMFEILEKRYTLMQFFKEALTTNDIVVKIGSENNSELIGDCSVITSGVRVEGETLGILGIIGPTRMDYAKNISTVYFVAKELARLFEQE